MKAAQKKIYVAFRFHVNFYHSYRGDSPDESGIGKDIRIIRGIIRDLDSLNEHGVPVRGTWDIENYFSLEKMMPQHCPDIIESLRRRAGTGQDEFELMSYNNGLLSAHTQEEFNAAIRWAIHNDASSGIADLFSTYAPLLRPQEMMYTPAMIKALNTTGVEAISLYYSGIPFSSFSNFIPQLSISERHNPLVLVHPHANHEIKLLPAVNHGDIVDHISLRRWVKKLRKQQLRENPGHDLLLLIDMDADDSFWEGYTIPVVSNLLCVTQGFKRLIQSIETLPFVEFTTPGSYLEDHPPLKRITISQDTADGSYDGYASWTEKWANHQLWTRIDQARLAIAHTETVLHRSFHFDFLSQSYELGPRLTPEQSDRQESDTQELDTSEINEISALARDSFEARIKALSTTHFGLSAPIMNRSRLQDGLVLAKRSYNSALQAFTRALNFTKKYYTGNDSIKSDQINSDLEKTKPPEKGTAGDSFTLNPAPVPIFLTGDTSLKGPNDIPNSSHRFPRIYCYDSQASAVTLVSKTHNIRTLLRCPVIFQPDETETSVPSQGEPGPLYLKGVSSDNKYLYAVVRSKLDNTYELLFREDRSPGKVKSIDFTIDENYSNKNRPSGLYSASSHKSSHKSSLKRSLSQSTNLQADENRLSNSRLKLEFVHGNPNLLGLDETTVLSGPFLSSGITYGTKRQHNSQAEQIGIFSWKYSGGECFGDIAAYVRFHGSTELPGGLGLFKVEREFLIAKDLPYLWLTLRVEYPHTPAWGCDPKKTRNLQGEYDRRWKEVWPSLITPDWEGPFTVWKHNYWGEVTGYSPHYGSFSKNTTLSSFNNHVTAGWVAISCGKRGLLIGQTSRTLTSAAFCPMRTHAPANANPAHAQNQRLKLNPFGTFDGPQLKSPIACTGLGRRAAVCMGEHYHSLAPSYNGKIEMFELMLAPYFIEDAHQGAPGPQLQDDAWENAFPGAIAWQEPSKTNSKPEREKEEDKAL